MKFKYNELIDMTNDYYFLKKRKYLIFLIILILILFFLIFQNKARQNINNSSNFILQNNSIQKIYSLKFMYVVLYENESNSEIDLYKKEHFRRLILLKQVIEKESYGAIQIVPKLIFLDIKEIGDKKINYSKRSIYNWIELLETYFLNKNKNNYDVLLFIPINDFDGSWCNDALSMGYNYNNSIYFCLENYLNPFLKFEDDKAISLIIHKLFHGFGYNHILLENQPFSFLEWNLGIPSTKLINSAINYDNNSKIILNKHIMKVLGFLPKNNFEKKCLDNQGLTCKNLNNFFCENSLTIDCLDVDSDSVRDSLDDYLFTPYGTYDHLDSDFDGISDDLDLCPWNEINITGNIFNKKTSGVSFTLNSSLTFYSPNVEIKQIRIFDLVNDKGRLFFPKNKFILIDGNIVKINLNNLLTNLSIFPKFKKIEIVYEFKNKTYFKPYYIYFKFQQYEYINQKEWFYFSRFGCDIPELVNFSNHLSYDQNLDGLPDNELFKFAEKINENYDWDSDGIFDIKDNLPTIHGNCSTSLVSGVPDSDNDGYCDPAFYFYSNKTYLDSENLHFIFQVDPEADMCPYFFGYNKGCPNLN
jgi:hypothetical protein